jgi:hypothetical protein
VDHLTRVTRSVVRIGAGVAVVATALTGCHADDPAGRPAPSLAPTTAGASSPVVTPYQADLPEVPLRFMYASGAGAEAVLVSRAGVTRTGQRASAYVATRTGAVFASGDRVYDLVDGGRAEAIGPVGEQSVVLQVDPTLRYVAWAVGRADGHARMIVHDVVAHRRVLDRPLPWGRGTRHPRITGFGAPRLRLVHLPQQESWSFATVSGRVLVTPQGQVVRPRSPRVDGPSVIRGLWSPGLRYRVSGARGRHPWQVVDLTTGRDLTPATLLGPDGRRTRLTGWLGNVTFGALTSSGTWRHTTVVASVCRVAGGCRAVWRLHLGVHDGGLQSSNEIG